MSRQVSYFTVTAEQAGQRLDNLLFTQLKGVPKSHIYRVIRSGEVRVNRGRVKPHYRVQTADSIRIPPIRVAEQSVPTQVPDYWQKRLQHAVLYEDEALLVLNKPAGMAVHGGSGVSIGVIESMRLLRPDVRYLELAHRLDRETSGCLLLAKRRSVLRELHRLLREHQIEKKYLALVKGQWPDSLQRVNLPLAKNVLASGERIAKVAETGKPSVTLFRVQQRYIQCTLIEAQPLSGRMHQIRVHTADSGYPIVGDDKYGDPACNSTLLPEKQHRLMLHARSIRLQLPASASEPLLITAPLDTPMQRILAQFM